MAVLMKWLIFIVKWAYGIYSIYKDNQEAIDEVIKDIRDYNSEFAWGIVEDMPNKFILEDKRWQHQGKTNYCTAFSTTTAANIGKWHKADEETEYSGFTLWDIMKEKGTMKPYWAFVIDAIKEGKTQGYFDSYYQVNNIDEIKSAIYRWDAIVTGSNKIDWTKTVDWLVKEKTKWYGHAFTLIGWDDQKEINWHIWAIYAENSWGKSAQDGGWFWIPYNLISNNILFYTKKAIYVKLNK